MAAQNTAPTVWITGAGSGIGRASAIAAARRGARVALSGRRPESLEQTAAAVREAGGTALVVPLDVTDAAAVATAGASIERDLGTVTELVIAAGLNVRERHWGDQSMSDFAAIVQTNLLAAASAVHAVLPGMRRAGGGTIAVISSYAGWRIAPQAGVAYSASKTALAALCGSINEEGADAGIRATHLCPGDVDTEFLAKRPEAPDAEQRRSMLSADDVARAVDFVLTSPPHVRIDELVISPIGVREG